MDYVIPALEIIDARSHGIDPDSKRPRKVFDTIADNAANAGVVLGGRPVKIGELDLRWIGAILSRNAVIEETGVAGVLNHPANGVVWLANKLAAHDVALEAGEIILSGSFTAGRRPRRRHLQRRLRRARLRQLPIHLSPSYMDILTNPSSRRCAPASPRSACGPAWQAPIRPRSAPAPASTGC